MAWLRCRDQSFYPVESLKEQFSSRFFSIASLMTFTSASFVGCPLIVRRTAKILTFDRNQCFIHPLIVCTIFQLPIEIISSILFWMILFLSYFSVTYSYRYRKCSSRVIFHYSRSSYFLTVLKQSHDETFTFLIRKKYQLRRVPIAFVLLYG